nr:MAG TPA: hypothetical protein [Caudoviricetes sp.]
MATKEKLDSIAASKAAIKAAIQEKGVSCDNRFSSYAYRIGEIFTEPEELEAPIEAIAEGVTFTLPEEVDLSTMRRTAAIIFYGENYSGMSVIIPTQVEKFPLYCILEETIDSHYVVKLECPAGAELSATILQKIE